MSELAIISVTPNLALDIKRNEIIEKIISRLTELKLVDAKYKNSADILLLICNLVEHLTRDKKLSKKDIVLEIFSRLFVLSADESVILESNIEFLHSNKAIKKLSKFYLFACGAYEYLFRSKKKEN